VTASGRLVMGHLHAHAGFLQEGHLLASFLLFLPGGYLLAPAPHWTDIYLPDNCPPDNYLQAH
jgi:hypothetical protein